MNISDIKNIQLTTKFCELLSLKMPIVNDFQDREVEYEFGKKYTIKSNQIKVISIGINKDNSHINISESGTINLLNLLESDVRNLGLGEFGKLNSIAIPDFGGFISSTLDPILISISFNLLNGGLSVEQIKAFERVFFAIKNIVPSIKYIGLDRLFSKTKYSDSIIFASCLKKVNLPHDIAYFPQKLNNDDHNSILEIFQNIETINTMEIIDTAANILIKSGFIIMSFGNPKILLDDFCRAIYSYILTHEPRKGLFYKPFYNLTQDLVNSPIIKRIMLIASNDKSGIVFEDVGDIGKLFNIISNIKYKYLIDHIESENLMNKISNLEDCDFSLKSIKQACESKLLR